VIDPEVIAAAAAARLNVPAVDLLESATAALEYIAADISGSTADLDPTNALLMIGARLLCERIYLDVSTRSGDLDALATVAMSGVLVPEDLGRHLRHYWTPAQHAWGIA
jgi:hypothetical protein